MPESWFRVAGLVANDGLSVTVPATREGTLTKCYKLSHMCRKPASISRKTGTSTRSSAAAIRMAAMDQYAKSSLRADVFRFAPNNGCYSVA
jgi:hypothetical protein